MKSKKLSSELSKFYSLFLWPSNPEDEKGKKYFKITLKLMKLLINNVWIREILATKKEIKIIEICGGAGFGGVALTKLLLENGLDVKLLVTDLRKETLETALKWGNTVIGNRIDVSLVDAGDVWKLKERFDIALMYGISTPHFNPWEIVKVFASVSNTLVSEGIFVVDEADRRYKIFLSQGYQFVLPEGHSDKFVVSFHKGYNPICGTFKRTFVNMDNPKIKLSAEHFFWGVAEVGALMWTFFEDIDFIDLKLKDMQYFILGYKPRKIITPQFLREPTILKKSIK